MSKDGPGLTDREIVAAFSESHWAEKFPPILTVDQAAELLAVPKATIYDWSSRGLLGDSAQKVGKHLRIFRNRFVTQAMNGGLSNDR